MKVRKLLAVPLLVGAMVLTACGGGGPSGESPAPEESIAPMSSQDINVQDRANLAQGGEIRLAVSSLAEVWNPMNANGNERDFAEILAAMLPTNFTFDTKGVPSPNPDYLVSATVTQESPTTTVQFKLNPSAVWGDGDPIDAEDYIAMWKACNGEDKGFQCIDTSQWAQMASVAQGADKFEVNVAFKSTFPDWQQPFSQIVRAESIKDPDTFNNGWGELKNEWLSGPFKLDKIDKTAQTVTEVPNDKWWGEKPLLDKLTYRVIAIDATPNAYVNGEIDSFDIGPDPNGFQLAAGVQGGAIRKAAGPNWRHITFNQKAGVLQEQAVRQAIVKGLDRTEIGASDLAGIDWPVRKLNNNLILENQEGYQDMGELTGIDLNVEQAKSDLEAAGWKAGTDGIREKDGKKLAVKFSALTGVPVSQNEALQVQTQLKEIGVKVDIIQVPSDKFSEVLVGKEFELIAFSWIGTPFPFNDVAQIYGTDQGNNFSNMSNEQVDTLAEQLKTEIDRAKRIDLANQAAKLIWEEVATLPLYQRPELIAVKANLANFGAFGLTAVQWEDVGYQK